MLQDFRCRDGVERLVPIRQGLGVGANDLNARRGHWISRRFLRPHGGDPCLEDIHRDDVEAGALGQREGESAMTTADVEHPRAHRTTRARYSSCEESLPREIFPFDVVGRLDEIDEDAVDPVLLGRPRLHGWRGSGACAI